MTERQGAASGRTPHGGNVELLNALRGHRASEVVDALYFLNAAHLLVMDPGIHAIKPGYRVHGFAFTVRYVPTQQPFPWISPELG